MSNEAGWLGEDRADLDEADLLNTFSADKKGEAAWLDAKPDGIRKSLMAMVMGRPALAVSPENLVDASMSVEEDVDGYSGGSSSFDASPASHSSMSSDSSEAEKASAARKMLNFTGSDNMDIIVQLFQGGTVGDMLEEDAEAGLAERLAGESDMQVAHDAAHPSSLNNSGSFRSGPASPSTQTSVRSRNSLSDPEMADAQFPSMLVKSAKLRQTSSRGSHTTASNSSSPGWNESMALVTPPSLVNKPCVAGAETSSAAQVSAGQGEHRTQGSEEEEEGRAMEATKKMWDASAAVTCT